MSRNKRSNDSPRAIKSSGQMAADKYWRKNKPALRLSAFEAAAQQATQFDGLLRASRKLTRNVPAAIELIWSENIKQLSGVPQNHRLHGIWELHHHKDPIIKNILLHLEKHKCDWFTRNIRARYVGAIRALAENHAQWERSLDGWIPKTRNAAKQLASLMRHLLAKYDVPSFMDEAWTSTHPVRYQRGEQHAIPQNVHRRDWQNWWIHIAKGGNIRKAKNLPFPLTKKMAHHFLQAPKNFGIWGAFRWGQIISLGGNERTVRAVMTTHLQDDFTETDFWASVIRFFIANPMLDTNHYGPIVDYIRNQKFIIPRGAETPPQPNLCMKNRDAEAMLCQVEAWHARLGGGNPKNKKKPVAWDHGDVPDFEWEEKKKKGGRVTLITYQIFQLLNAKELAIEGRRLQHCVSSYAWSCARGQVSIWSIRRLGDGDSWGPLGTIELNNGNKTVTQFRAKKNSIPGPKAQSLLDNWMAKNGLRKSRWIV